MFDLLYDRTLRQHFIADSIGSLSGYELDEEELNDFKQIRTDALEIDATMRVYMVLAQLCRELPLTFSITSSFPGGIEKLKSLVDKSIMQSSVSERAATFAVRVRDWLATEHCNTEVMQSMMLSIVGAEIAMASTNASLKQAVAAGEKRESERAAISRDWISQPAKLTDYVCAVIIPRPHAELKQKLCAKPDEQLWAHLCKKPLSATLLDKTLKQEDPRLLVARAMVSHLKYCEPTISQQTIELSEGFAALFQHLDGKNSVDAILSQLKLAGAPEQMLQGVKSGFNELLEQGVLEVG